MLSSLASSTKPQVLITMASACGGAGSGSAVCCPLRAQHERSGRSCGAACPLRWCPHSTHTATLRHTSSDRRAAATGHSTLHCCRALPPRAHARATAHPRRRTSSSASMMSNPERNRSPSSTSPSTVFLAQPSCGCVLVWRCKWAQRRGREPAGTAHVQAGGGRRRALPPPAAQLTETMDTRGRLGSAASASGALGAAARRAVEARECLWGCGAWAASGRAATVAACIAAGLSANRAAEHDGRVALRAVPVWEAGVCGAPGACS